MIGRILFSVTLATATIVTAPAITAACGNAMFVDGDDAVKQVSEAERLLALGKLKKAQQKVEPHRYHFDDQGVEKRAKIVWASVALRLDNSTAASWQVQRAVSSLENMLKEDKDSPVLIARLAEAYAFGDDSKVQAKTMLEDLAARDLMPDAFGYQTLAHLRAASGEQDAAGAALAMCKTMTKRKNVCTLATQKVNLKKVDTHAPPVARAPAPF